MPEENDPTTVPRTTPHPGRSLWGDAVRRLRRDWGAMVCLTVILLYAAVGVVSPLLFPNWAASYDYERINRGPSLFQWPPSLEAPLGTDEFGRSVFQKVLLGANTSMKVGLMANIIAVPLGMLLGAVAGYHGRRVDDVIVWLYTTISVVPGIILLIAIRFAFMDRVFFPNRPWEIDLSGMAGIYLALALMSWIGTCRLVRAEVMKLRELDYVLAARAIGTGGFMVLLRHIIPNVLHIGIINFSLGFIGAITAEVILSFLGLGVGTGVPSWGAMIDASRMDLVIGRWWELASAVGAMFFLILALNVFGDRLRDSLDPRLKRA